MKTLILKTRSLTEPQTIVLGFLLLIAFGGILLSLPFVSQSHQTTPFLDALFTATSAVCVTGQVTLNTSTHWNYIGKTIIIILIELGGLGFMTLWIFFINFIGQRTNLRQNKLMLESLNLSSMSEVRPMVVFMISFSIFAQLLGASLLSIRMVPAYGWKKGLYYAVFHSISAFCNAGFDLFGDSLISFQQDPLVLLTISLMIFTGGLGFLVWRDLLSYYKKRKFTFHTKIVLTTTLTILLTSWALFALTEGQHGTFSHLKLSDRLFNYLFLAITPRTAGYANLDYTQLSLAGVFLTFLLMFVGGSSGSIAGGAKVTTLGVIFIYVLRGFQNKPTVAFRRTIPYYLMKRAIFILFTGLTIVLVSSFILLMTETIPAGFGVEYVLMEVISCFGTVGLSLGLTPHLTALGKLILMVIMFVGRIGLLTFFMSFNSHQAESKVKYPESTLMVG